MSATASENRPWWSYAPVATKPSKTDVGLECGHTRDKHDAQGKCLIFDRTVPAGGDDGVIMPDQGELYESDGGGKYKLHYHRPACFCPGESVWHEAQLPPGFEWDTLNETGWRDPEAKHTTDGRYIWWLPPKKEK